MPLPTGFTSPGLPIASRSIRAAIRARAFESFRFVSQASNVTERRISYTETLSPIVDMHVNYSIHWVRGLLKTVSAPYRRPRSVCLYFCSLRRLQSIVYLDIEVSNRAF